MTPRQQHPNKSHRSLYTAIVIGDALHVSRILPVCNTFFIQGAPPEDETCEPQITHTATQTHTHVQRCRIGAIKQCLYSATYSLLNCCDLSFTHGIGRTAYGCCVPCRSHLPHNVGEVILSAYLVRLCTKAEAEQASVSERHVFIQMEEIKRDFISCTLCVILQLFSCFTRVCFFCIKKKTFVNRIVPS